MPGTSSNSNSLCYWTRSTSTPAEHAQIASYFADAKRPIALKIEISPDIQLTGTDSCYGRKQAILIPQDCHSIHDVKEHVKSVMQLPPDIHFYVGDFCLRDDQDVSILSCFNETVRVENAIVEERSVLQLIPILHLNSRPKSVRLSLPEISDSISSTPANSTPLLPNGQSHGEKPRKQRGKKRLLKHDEDEIDHEGSLHLDEVVSTKHSRTEVKSESMEGLEAGSSPESKTGAGGLTKSAKRRLRKFRLQKIREEQFLQQDNSLTPTSSINEEASKPTRKLKKRKNQEDINSSACSTHQSQIKEADSKVQVKSSIPAPVTESSMDCLSSICEERSMEAPSTDEFVKPKVSKAKKVRAIREENVTPYSTASDVSRSSTFNSNGKPRTDTPKIFKNPMLFGGPGQFSLSFPSSGESGSSSQRTKPDTPNLPFISKSPHYNYVLNQRALSSLSRQCKETLSAEEDKGIDESASGSCSINKEKIIEHSKAIVAAALTRSKIMDVDHKETASESISANSDEISKTAEMDDSFYENLESIISADEIKEGFIIAFKTTELSQNVPVISTFKRACVKSKINSVFQLQYLDTSNICQGGAGTEEGVDFEIEGYEIDSPNNPEYLEFGFMISPKFFSKDQDPNRMARDNAVHTETK